MKKYLFGLLIFALVLVISSSCKKDTANYDYLYTPTAIDTTSTATLAQLQQGRKLYINNCGNCHSIPSPDSYSGADWYSILSQMVPRTGLNSGEASLISKYLNRGQ
jgi:cytochrome c5